jgi:hypothetical protein
MRYKTEREEEEEVAGHGNRQVTIMGLLASNPEKTRPSPMLVLRASKYTREDVIGTVGVRPRSGATTVT